MTTHCPGILNQLIDAATDSYLELGCNTKQNINAITAHSKYSVDILSQFAPDFCGSTDDFFKQNTKNYEFIFIDANHDYDYVVRDLINSSKIAIKCIALHDMNPPDKGYTHPGQCSDSYKLLTLLKKETNIEIFTLSEDFGLSFIPITEKAKNIVLSDELIEQYRNLSYEDYVAYRDEHIPLYNTEQIVEKVKSVWQCQND